MAESECPKCYRHASGAGNAEKQEPASDTVIEGKVNTAGGQEAEKDFVQQGKMGNLPKSNSPFQTGKYGIPVKPQMKAQSNDHDIPCHVMNLMGQKGRFLHAGGKSMGNEQAASHDGTKGSQKQDVRKKGKLPVRIPPSPRQGNIPLPVKPGVQKEKKKENNRQCFMSRIPHQAVIQKDQKGQKHSHIYKDSSVHNNLLWGNSVNNLIFPYLIIERE